MSMKQWLKLILGLIALSLLVLGVFYYVESKDGSKDSIEEVKEEQQEKRKKVSKSVTEMLGLEEGERLLTKEEIKDFITKLKRDEGEEVVTDMYIKEKIREEYGKVNAVAYREGLMIEEDDSDFVKSQVIRELASVLGDTNIAKGIPLVYISNPIDDEFDNEKYKEPSEVFVSSSDYPLPLYRTDTNGFKDVGHANIGYPNISYIPYNFNYIDSNKLDDLEDEYIVNVEVSMLVEETMTLKEVYDIYNKTEVYIGGDKLDPLGTNIKKYDEDFVKDFVKDLNLSGVIHGLEEYEFTGSDLNNKYVLKDTVVKLGYEYDLTNLTDGENKFVEDGLYYDLDYENTPVINVNGEEFLTEIGPVIKLRNDEYMGKEVTEEMEKEAHDSNIYYKK